MLKKKLREFLSELNVGIKKREENIRLKDNKLSRSILKGLYSRGLIGGYNVKEGYICVNYAYREVGIFQLEQKNLYMSYKEIIEFETSVRGEGFYTTSKGLMWGKDVSRIGVLKVGGEQLFILR